jgi:predicted amidohydrolase YtcJ
MFDNRANRRGFLGMTASGVIALAGGRLNRAMAAGLTDPDVIVINAKVYTVDPRQPNAEAFAIRGDRFVAVGSSAEIKDLAGKSTRVVDAKGTTIVPGFIDCHNHAPGETLLYEALVGNPFEVEFVTIDSIISKLRERAAKTPPGFWVEGYFHDDTKVKDGRPLNVQDLDKVSSEHPVMVRHRGGHTIFVNSKAYELAGITKDTPNPPGGTLDRAPDGNLNGRVTDTALGLFSKAGQRATYTEAERAERARRGLAHISKQFVRYGVTTVHHEGGDLSAIQQVRAAGELHHRISYEPLGADLAKLSRSLAVLDGFMTDGIRTGFGDEWVRVGATAEHLADGSFSERTMALSTPYPGSNPPYKGNIIENQQQLNEWAERVHRAGIQLNCHANGDVAIDMVLTAYERALQVVPAPDARPKITHCTLVNDDLIRRMKAINAVPAIFSTYSYYNSDKFEFYGEQMLEHSIALRSMLDAGLYPAAGSDFSPGPFAPLMAIQGMVTRTGWDGKTWGANQRISVAEGLRVNTLNGAYNSHEENSKGSITPGKLADYVVLADDIHTVDPSKIKDVQIVQTVTGGIARYSA